MEHESVKRRYSGFWYQVSKTVLRFYKFFCIHSIQLQGKENLLTGQSKIIVAIHANATDAFVLPFIVPDKLHFLILEENFSIPVFGRLLALADQIPVVLGRGREGLSIAKKRLFEWNSVVIFPEGYLTHGKRLRRAGAGAAILACETGRPIGTIGFFVPSKFTHTFRRRFFNRGTVGRWQVRGNCFVHVGNPIFAPPDSGFESTYRFFRHLTDNVMAEISNLVKQATENANG